MEDYKDRELKQLKEELNDERTINDSIMTIFLVIFILGMIFEIGILIISFIYADNISCNLLWCTFTTHLGSSSSSDITTTTYISSTSTTTSTCYDNGKLINCSELKNP